MPQARWVARFIEQELNSKPEYGLRMIKGSHIVVPALHDGNEAYILQNSDKRIVFVIPWLQQWSMIGTTDVEYHGDPADVAPSAEEEELPAQHRQQTLSQADQRDDIVHRFAGVRPLCHDESDAPSAITRDYTLTVSERSEPLPLLNVFGGKLTTYRKLAESALAQTCNPGFRIWVRPGPTASPARWRYSLAMPRPSSSPTATPGCHRRWRCVSAIAMAPSAINSWTPAHRLEDMGEHFGNDLYQREVDYLIEQEWARGSR